MFCGCSLLKEINLSNFNTKNIKNMISMFCRCSSLKELNLSYFRTNKVNDIKNLFYGFPFNLSIICTNNLIQKEYEKLNK